MNILQKTLLILGAVFAVLLLVFYISSRAILLGSYRRLELEQAYRNLERAANALERDLEEIDRFTADWAHWDDTYEFAADPAGQVRYLETNLVDSTFLDGEFNYILYFDRDGSMIYGKGFDLAEVELEEIPEDTRDSLSVALLDIPEPGSDDHWKGLLRTGREPLLFAARPILTSGKQGPARGWMVMGRYLGEGLREKLEEITQLDLTFYPADGELDSGVPSPAELAAAEVPPVRFPGPGLMAAYALLPDAGGRPGLILEIRLPREIIGRGLATIRQYFLWILAASAAVMAVTAFALHRFVIRPVHRLIRRIGRIGETGSFSSRLPEAGGDDLARLARALNRMLSALEQATADLRKSEERYRGVVEDQTELICRFTPGGVLTFSNRAFEQASGGGRGGPDGNTFFDRLPEGEREGLRKTLAGLKAGGPAVAREFKVGSGDAPRVEQWTFRRLSAGEGGRGEIQAVGRDITRRKELEEKLLKAHKLESLGTLAGGIAHDFNNVLTAILGNISLARTWGGPETPPVSEVLADAENACLKARGLTHQLLTFSSGGRPVRRPVNLGPVIEQSARMALSGSTARGVFRIADDLWPAEADEGQIGQAVHNLVLNAVQAMPGGGEIEISAENLPAASGEEEGPTPPPGLKIVVRDRGIGIPEDIRERIFDPYFTTKQAGSGLGLAIVYSIVRNHGGDITVRSRPGRGSDFTLLLPADPEISVPPPDLEDHPLRGAGRILVMDDEEAVRRAACLMLSSLGYTPVGVADGREMLEVYRRAKREGEPFDAVIVDLTVRGGMGGVEANRELLGLDPEAVTIVTSGYSSDPVLDRYREYGFRGVIPKPFRLAALAEVLSSVLSPSPKG